MFSSAPALIVPPINLMCARSMTVVTFDAKAAQRRYRTSVCSHSSTRVSPAGLATNLLVALTFCGSAKQKSDVKA